MGQVIGNRYEIQQELGAGGMGTVFLGVDRQSQANVAIKQLKKELTEPEMLERFQREGQALRDLNHPNIVKLLDAVEDAGKHFLVMEYVAGGDLKQLLEKGKLPYQRTLNIAIDLADALTRAHRLNIIHRDLKPANVLVAEDGTIRLTDFGVAHVIDKERVTETNAIVGTLDYLPPEAINGDPVDNRSDIWAFGVMLFEMLAGKRPFSTGSILQTMHAILTASIPDLEELAPDAPIALVDLVYRMLSRDPQARISSVRFVGAELEEILQGRDSRPMTRRFETPIPDFRQRPKHNLPAQTTPFVGRESELTELARILDNPSIRLVTILAQGGMGKTRLSLEAAERQISNFEHGVYFVELAPLSDVDGIIPAIANALNYQFQSDGRDEKQQICDFLQAKEVLLVLDNFEHLLAGAELVSDLLKAAPKLKILATSRQRLDQAGESLFHLSGMDFPNWETPDDALEYAAVKLFMNSATRAKPDFELTTVNLGYVARICRLVQGMPLGIVLAAAWLGMLSPQEVSEELQKGLDFLESDSQQIPERQRSIRAVMEYSWRQMSEAEQAVFAKLSVFRGGFTREAAEGVTGANLRILMSLVNKSLLHRDSTTGRYEIHELLRQYAEEKADLVASRNAHSQYFAQWMQAREVDLKGNRDLEAVKAIYRDYENVKAAWHWAVEQRHYEQLEQMFEALHYHFYFTTQYREAMNLATPALKLRENPVIYSKAHAIYHSYHYFLTDQVSELDKSFEMAQEYLEPSWQDIIVAALGNGLVDNREFVEAVKLLEIALPVIEKSGDKWATAHMIYEKGNFLIREGKNAKFEEAVSLWEKANQLYTELDNKWGKALIAYNLGIVYAYKYKYEQALKSYQEMLVVAEDYQSYLLLAHTYHNISNIYILLGHYEKGLEAAQETQRYVEQYNLTPLLQVADCGVIWSLIYLERFEEAETRIRTLYGRASTFVKGSQKHQVWLKDFYYFTAKLAFRQRNYAEAVASFKNYFELPINSSFISHQFVEAEMAYTEQILGDRKNAEPHLLAVLAGSNEPMVSLICLCGIAYLAYQKGQGIKALEYAALVLEHHATEYEFKQYAKELLTKIEAEMPVEDYQAAYELGKSLDLEAVIQEILAQADQ
jgi:serine/threonine protein kinase/tetratricopeptide (TPR) repeat protein